jgi:ubiquinone biosynthesis monooxygenase Coq7
VSVLRELRTDHAGEAGAVQIYRGILAVSQDPVVRQFALCHLRTELQHLRCIRRWVPRSERSRLLRLWRMAGWLTGALPAVLGPRAVFATVAAVERFVDQHYSAQISALAGQPALAPLRATLENFRRDEVAHRDEALAHLSSAPGLALRLWATVVGRGSAAAVAISRRW